jgi:asparagine synthase (glutamine-hydrolysing)
MNQITETQKSKILFDQNYGWLCHHFENGKDNDVLFYGRGDIQLACTLVPLINQDIDFIVAALDEGDNFSGGILETERHIMAWADHIRSFPLFYHHSDEQFLIGNNPRKIQNEAHLNTINQDSLKAFMMAGYVSGADTMYDSLSCLQPGEMIRYDKQTQTLETARWYQYDPIPTDTPRSFDANYHDFNALLDTITKKVIARAAGRMIAVPLSAGLDSRILLCKLHEHGYKNLMTFTYGPRFNFEARLAKKIAQKLDLPWHFISTSSKKYRELFQTPQRKDYWDYADGLKAAPSMREYSALALLREKNLIPDDAVIVNGQSGDYISGGHIPAHWHNNTLQPPSLFTEKITKKHYGLWKSYHSDEAVSREIEKIIALPQTPQQAHEWALLEEVWEYDARQVCLVINGQRSYEFFGYDWELPLWERSVVDFFETMPLEKKFNQRFYKDYLKHYNYKDMFKDKERYIWRWPMPMLWVVAAAQIIGRIKGTQAKKNFYARMRYYGHYANQYAVFPYQLHKETCSEARNIFSLYVRLWAIENKIELPEGLKKAMFLS